MAKGKKGKSKGRKKAPKKSPEPLPGPRLLKLVRTYSEDIRQSQAALPYPNLTVLREYLEPPPDDTEEAVPELDDKSSQGDVEPRLAFDLEQQPSQDDLFKLLQAEEYSDDAKSGSSFTDDIRDELPEESEEENSRETASESTGSETDVERDMYYDVDVSEFDSDIEAGTFEFPDIVPTSVDDNDTNLSPAAAEARRRKKKAAINRKANRAWKADGFVPNQYTSRADWIVDSFFKLLESKTAASPLKLTIDDLLETNINFDTLDSDTIDKLTELASRSSSPERSRKKLKDFEVPVKFEEKLREPVKPLVTEEPIKKPNATGGKNVKAKVVVVVEKPKELPKKYPAEEYEEPLLTDFYRKPHITGDEMQALQQDQELWTVGDTPDLALVEKRRTQLLQGAKVPLGEPDFEIDILTTEMSRRALEFEEAVNKAFPGEAAEQTAAAHDRLRLPPVPLVPVCVNPDEDPDDENTSEDEFGGPTYKTAKPPTKAAVDKKLQYKLPIARHEDDLHDYYNSDRSSSECESVHEIIRSSVAHAVFEQAKLDTSSSETGKNVWDVQLAGQKCRVSLPLDRRQLNRFPVDDLYALAHDLRMPPSLLRKELLAAGDVTTAAVEEEDGLAERQAQFLYEKSPDFYAVQIKDLQQSVQVAREQWINLDLEQKQFAIKTTVEGGDFVRFDGLMTEELIREIDQIEELKVKALVTEKELLRITEEQAVETTWLTGQRDKIRNNLSERRTFLQTRLTNWKEYTEKQRRLETKMKSLQKQERRTRKAYQQKVSTMLFDSARRKEELFKSYKAKIDEVFIEYQRALILSMNDNLQEACCDHIEGRHRAKKFSAKAVRVMERLHRLATKMERAQHTALNERELLSLSKNHAAHVERRHRRLEAQHAHEARKLELLETSLKVTETAEAYQQTATEVSKDNEFLENLKRKLEDEKATLTKHLQTEGYINQQMEKHINNVVASIRTFLEYQLLNDPNDTSSAKLHFAETFEDRFTRFLQYANEIEELTTEEVNKRKPIIRNGDFGLVPKKRKKRR